MCSSDLYLEYRFDASATLPNGSWIEIAQMQIEAGSTATPFTTATGNIQAELAACQRYYYRQSGGDSYGCWATGGIRNTTTAYAFMPLPVTMRVQPFSMDLSTISLEDYSGTTYNTGTFTLESGAQQDRKSTRLNSSH